MALHPPLAGGAIDLVREHTPPDYAVTTCLSLRPCLPPVLDAYTPARKMNHSSPVSLPIVLLEDRLS